MSTFDPEHAAAFAALAAAANSFPAVPVQLTAADLKGMAPDQLLAAQKAGLCDTLLGFSAKMPPRPAGVQLTAADLKDMSPGAIVKAQAEGLCRDLLTGTPTRTAN